MHVRLHGILEVAYFGDFDVIQIATLNRVQRHAHFRDAHWRILLLLHQLHHALTTFQLATSRIIQVGSELRERGELTILSERQAHATAKLLDDTCLRSTTHARHRQTSVDSRTDVCVEKVGLQEDLTVGDGDHVGRNERRDVTSLRFNDRQRRQRTGLAFHFAIGELFHVLCVDSSSTLQQTGVQIEDISRIGFATRRTTQQQGDLAVRPGLFGQVVVYDQRVFATVTEVLTHRAARVRCDVLHRGRLGGGRGNHNRVVHCAVLFKFAHDASNRRCLLANRDIYALNAGAFLVDDGINSHRRLTGLAVTNNQLALAASDWHHGVDGFQACLHRLVNRLTFNNARRNLLNRRELVSFHRAFTVDRLTQRVDDTTQQVAAGRHFQNTARAFDGVAFGNVRVVTQDNRANGVAFQIKRQTVAVAGEFDHLPLHGIAQAVNTRNTVGQ